MTSRPILITPFTAVLFGAPPLVTCALVVPPARMEAVVPPRPRVFVVMPPPRLFRLLPPPPPPGRVVVLAP